MDTFLSKDHVHPPNNSPPNGHADQRSDYHINKLHSLASRSQDVLLYMKSVFPFDLFPDEVSIDENKVNIVFHEFFFSSDIHSVMIPLIKDVEVETSILFGTLKIVPDGYPAQPISVRYLRKQDALRARRIILGLMVSKKEGIDTSKLHEHSMCSAIENVGEATSVE